MKAILLAGGESSRFFPLNAFTEKSLMHLPNGKPIIREIVDNIAKSFLDRDIWIVCHQRHEQAFRHEFRDIEVDIIPVTNPGGTLSDTREVLKHKPGDEFLIHYCDMLIDIDYGDVLAEWFNRADCTKAMAVLTQIKSEYSSAYVSRVTGKKIVHRFVEKPVIESPIWTGVGIFTREVIEKSMLQQTDFGKHLLPELATKLELEAYITKGLWVDLGSLTSYRKLLLK